MGFPGGSDGKESACNTGDPGSIPGSGQSPGEGTSNPFQYTCLGNPMDMSHSQVFKLECNHPCSTQRLFRHPVTLDGLKGIKFHILYLLPWLRSFPMA